MNSRFFIVIALFLAFGHLSAQQVVFDPQHLVAVTENAVVRSGAESAHAGYLGKISDNVGQVNAGIGAVVVAQQTIYHALADVSSVLADGLAVKRMASVASDIYYYLAECAVLARGQPYLAACAAGMTSQLESRAVTLSGDVEAFVLSGGQNILMDYNARDELLIKIIQQLQVIDGLAYGAYRAMFWARQRGLVALAGPFAAFVSHDRNLAAQILARAKYLER